MARLRSRSQRGFSILELAVVAGTISVLSAIAIPRVTIALKRSRAVEVVTTISAIERALAEFYNRNDRYPPTAGAQNPPTAALGSYEMGATVPGWEQIGFTPEGSYRYRYTFTSSEAGDSVIIEAIGDTDGDGHHGRYVRVLTKGFRDPDGDIDMIEP